MYQKVNYVNAAFLKGVITKINFLYENKVNIKVYSATLLVKRHSKEYDSIPIHLRESDLEKVKENSFVKITGEIRTTNFDSKLLVFVWVNEISPLEKEEYENSIVLTGMICKLTSLRKTPLTEKKIIDFILAVNNPCKSNYIPTIAWQNAADIISNLSVGTAISLKGRFQSRRYLKNYEDGQTENKIAYEVSVLTFSVI